MTQLSTKERLASSPAVFARELLARLELKSARDLLVLTERLGLSVKEVASDGFEGVLVCRSDRRKGIIAINDGIREEAARDLRYVMRSDISSCQDTVLMGASANPKTSSHGARVHPSMKSRRMSLLLNSCFRTRNLHHKSKARRPQSTLPKISLSSLAPP